MRTVLLVLIAGWLGVAGTLAAQSPERRVTGAEVRLNVRGHPTDVRGELLAVADDTVWIRRIGNPGSVPFAFHDVGAVRVRTHEAGGTWTMTRVLVGWGVTALGMNVACVQAEGVNCPVVPLVMAIPWGIIGGVAATSNESGTWLRFLQEELTALRPYSRFPQGLPASLRPRGTLETLHPDPGRLQHIPRDLRSFRSELSGAAARTRMVPVVVLTTSDEDRGVSGISGRQ